MTLRRTRSEKVAMAIATAATVWVVGATLFYSSGGLNTSGLLPSAGCLIALWGAIRSDVRMMWLGTSVVVVAAVLLVFSVGLVVLPAALALILGSIVLQRSDQPTD